MWGRESIGGEDGWRESGWRKERERVCMGMAKVGKELRERERERERDGGKRAVPGQTSKHII